MTLEEILELALKESGFRASISRCYTDVYIASGLGILHRQMQPGEDSLEHGKTSSYKDYPRLPLPDNSEFSQDRMLRSSRIPLTGMQSIAGCLFALDRTSGAWCISATGTEVVPYKETAAELYTSKDVQLYTTDPAYDQADFAGCSLSLAPLASKDSPCLLVERDGESLYVVLRRPETVCERKFEHDGETYFLDGFNEKTKTYRRIAIMAKLAMPCKETSVAPPAEAAKPVEQEQEQEIQQTREPFEDVADAMVENGEIEVISNEPQETEDIQEDASADYMQDDQGQDPERKVKRNIPPPTPIGFDFQPVIDNCSAAVDRTRPMTQEDMLKELRALRETMKACASRMYKIASIGVTSSIDAQALVEHIDSLARLVHK